MNELTPGLGSQPAARRKTTEEERWLEFAIMTGIVIAATILAVLLRPHIAPAKLAMVFLLGVVAISTRCSSSISVLGSFLSVAAFDFFCVPPYLTLRVSDYGELITFGGMLVVALVISTQTSRIRMQADDALDREARTAALYRLSHRLAEEARLFDAAKTAAGMAEDLFRAPVTIFLPEDGKITFRRRTSDTLPVPSSEEPVAQWVLDHGRSAGCRTPTLSDATALYLPLKGVKGVVGVMAALAQSRDAFRSAEERSFLDAFADHTGLALERTLSQTAASENHLKMRTEEMRSSLLSTVSHDLRTPLASITGAASTLRSQDEKLSPETRRELLDSISDEAERLSRLVRNLLDMTRLQSGVKLRLELYPVEEIVGGALQRIDSQLIHRKLTITLPDSLPPIPVDDVLFGQVITNLVENAVKYTPADTEIEIFAEAMDGVFTLEVRDQGPGFQEGDEFRIFEKFYRGKQETGRGVGLGLAICRAIVEAHHGTIQALRRSGGGAIFRICLPLKPTA